MLDKCRQVLCVLNIPAHMQLSDMLDFLSPVLCVHSHCVSAVGVCMYCVVMGGCVYGGGCECSVCMVCVVYAWCVCVCMYDMCIGWMYIVCVYMICVLDGCAWCMYDVCWMDVHGVCVYI